MKKLLPLLFISLAFGLSAQGPSSSRLRTMETTSVLEQTPIIRYGTDYELKNYIFTGDSTILDGIDLLEIERARLPQEDVEVYDSRSGVTVILYSYAKVEAIRNQGSSTLNQGK